MDDRPLYFQKGPDMRRVCLLAILASTSPLAAQDLIYTFEGDSTGDHLGETVCGPGDLNGDGYADIIVGASGDDLRQLRGFSGADGSFLFALFGASPGDFFGSSVDALGDVSGDGVGDFVVGASSGGYARVFSGADRSILFEVSFPPYNFPFPTEHGKVAAVGDVNVDGTPDFAVGLPFNTEEVRVYSGVDGAPLLTLTGDESYFGTDLDAAGDVNADGYPDIVVGSWATGFTFSGHMWVKSGLDGSNLYTFGGGDWDLFGAVVAGVGDVNADGHDDVLAVAAVDDLDGHGPAYARVFSGASGDVLHHISFGVAALGREAATGVGDQNGDGVPDLLIAGTDTFNSNDRWVRLYSGADASLLVQIDVQNLSNRSIAATGDTNGDGVPDFVLGNEWAGPNGAQSGKAFVYGMLCGPPPASFCATSPNSAGPGATMGWTGSTSIANNDLELRVEAATPSQSGIFYYGPEQASVPFGDGLRCVGDGGVGLFRLDVLTTDAAGAASFPLDNTDPPTVAGQIAAGQSWSFQFWYRDPNGPGGSGFNLSDGLGVSFCP